MLTRHLGTRRSPIEARPTEAQPWRHGTNRCLTCFTVVNADDNLLDCDISEELLQIMRQKGFAVKTNLRGGRCSLKFNGSDRSQLSRRRCVTFAGRMLLWVHLARGWSWPVDVESGPAGARHMGRIGRLTENTNVKCGN